MEKVRKILIVAGLALLCRCSTEYEEVAPDTELAITVVDENGLPVEGASLYRTAVKSVFLSLVASGGSSSDISPAITGADGKVLVTWGADSTYIYVIRKNEDLFPGTYITEDNADGEYVLKNSLAQGSISNLRITIKPADGFITFWTTSANTSALPVDMFLGTTASGLLSQTASSAPAPFQTGGLTVRARIGNLTIEGKSQSGCFWTDQVPVVGGQNLSYQLTNCSVGTIAFYTDNSNAAQLPVTVTLNANDAIGNISSSVSVTPTDCSAVGLVKAVRTPGTYTYEAISSTGNCAWAGTFTLSANECKLILLTTCN